MIKYKKMFKFDVDESELDNLRGAVRDSMNVKSYSIGVDAKSAILTKLNQIADGKSEYNRMYN